jgi:hypothetical protein
MPCLLALIAFFFPRLVIILLVLGGDYIGRAYASTLVPLLGFFFMPYTTLAYAWGINSGAPQIEGFEIIVMVLAVLMDLGVIGGGATAGSKRMKSG